MCSVGLWPWPWSLDLGPWFRIGARICGGNKTQGRRPKARGSISESPAVSNANIRSTTIEPFATPEGTDRYRNRFPNAATNHFRNQQGLTLSSIGIGTYLGNANAAADQSYTESIVRAVELGANVSTRLPTIVFNEVNDRLVGHSPR